MTIRIALTMVFLGSVALVGCGDTSDPPADRESGPGVTTSTTERPNNYNDAENDGEAPSGNGTEVGTN